MSTWVGMGPVIGPGSLDGFAVGVMMSGAVFLAVTTPRRARRRQAVAAGTAGMMAAGPREWLSRRARAPRLSGTSGTSGLSGTAGVPGARPFDAGVLEPGAFEAGAFGPAPFGVGPFAPDAERLARPDEPGALNDPGWAPSVGDDGRAAGGHRSRHRLNEPLPGSTSPDRAPRGGTSRDGGLRGDVAPGGAPRGRAVPGGAPRSSGGFPDSAFPESAFPDSAFPESRFPDVALPDVAFPGEAPWRSGRPEAPAPGGVFPDGEQPWASPAEAPHGAGQLEPLPDMAPRDGRWLEPRDGGRLEPRDGRRLEPPFPDWAARDGEPIPNGASRDRGRPDVEFPDVAFPDGTFGTSKRPDSRRLPRHAAPAVGLGSKVSHWMTGLFARPLTSGAHG